MDELTEYKALVPQLVEATHLRLEQAQGLTEAVNIWDEGKPPCE